MRVYNDIYRRTVSKHFNYYFFSTPVALLTFATLGTLDVCFAADSAILLRFYQTKSKFLIITNNETSEEKRQYLSTESNMKAAIKTPC